MVAPSGTGDSRWLAAAAEIARSQIKVYKNLLATWVPGPSLHGRGTTHRSRDLLETAFRRSSNARSVEGDLRSTHWLMIFTNPVFTVPPLTSSSETIPMPGQ
jgi:hypothetical protein